MTCHQPLSKYRIQSIIIGVNVVKVRKYFVDESVAHAWQGWLVRVISPLALKVALCCHRLRGSVITLC